MKQTDKKKPRVGVKWKLFGYLAAFSAIILTTLWICQVLFLDDIYKLIKTAEIRRAAVKLTESVGSDGFESDAADIAGKNNVCVRVFLMIDRNNAREILSLDTQPNCMSHNMSRIGVFTLFDAAEDNSGKVLRRYRYDESTRIYYSVGESSSGNEDPSDEESIIYALITKTSDGAELFIILNSVISPVGATVRTLNALLCIISGILIAAAFVFAFVMSKHISKTIADINAAAKQLAAGEYDADFSVKGYKEIAELSETLRYAASELSKVENMRRELIANISHDLRTPLTLINGYGEVMRDIPGENTPENMQVILDETARLTSLVNDVLDISKLQSGVQQIHPAEVRVTQTVKDAIERYNKLVEHKGYIITFSYDREAVTVTDETRFLQAFYNLLNNAVTYTGDDKTVSVRQEIVDTDGTNQIRISVSDSGEGIAPDKLPLIWDRYYKIDANHKRAAVGSGLGLSIVRTVMDMLGGAYGVESTVGIGSTFWISLPIKSEESGADSP